MYRPIKPFSYRFYFKHSLLCYDFTANTTLDDFLKNSEIVLNLDALLVLAIDLICAIQYVEEKGVVHNNITTSNVLIERGLRVRLQKCNTYCFV